MLSMIDSPENPRPILYSGHTMGAPGWNIYEVIRGFREIGYDAIEVRVALDGQINSETVTDEECIRILAAAREEGMAFSCLTSYYKSFLPAEKRAETVAKLRRVVEIAHLLECPLVRVYGGDEPRDLPDFWYTDVWSDTVAGIREVASYAARFGVKLCIETHVGSLTMSVRDTLRMVHDVNMQNVGILFDYAWVHVAGVEGPREAVRMAAGHIFHVHVKDFRIRTLRPLDKSAALIGEGDLPWSEVIDELVKIGYRGYISDEYEAYWYPDDLPPCEVGMRKNLLAVKALEAASRAKQ